MADELKTELRGKGHNLTTEQRLFFVESFARYMTVQEVIRAWVERWPGVQPPSAQALYRYRPPLVLQGQYAEAFQTERDRYRADLPAFAEKHKRLECLHEMVQSLRDRIAALPSDERREVVADLYEDDSPDGVTRSQRRRKGVVKTVRATRLELERALRETCAQIDDEMGKVIRLEHSGSLTLSYRDLMEAVASDDDTT